MTDEKKRKYNFNAIFRNSNKRQHEEIPANDRITITREMITPYTRNKRIGDIKRVDRVNDLTNLGSL